MRKIIKLGLASLMILTATATSYAYVTWTFQPVYIRIIEIYNISQSTTELNIQTGNSNSLTLTINNNDNIDHTGRINWVASDPSIATNYLTVTFNQIPALHRGTCGGDDDPLCTVIFNFTPGNNNVQMTITASISIPVGTELNITPQLLQ